MRHAFSNEPLTDFSVARNVAAFKASIEKVCAGLGRTYPLVIGGEKIYTRETFDSTNPSNSTQVIGKMAKATPEFAVRAVEAAAEAFEHWRWVPYEERAALSV